MPFEEVHINNRLWVEVCVASYVKFRVSLKMYIFCPNPLAGKLNFEK